DDIKMASDQIEYVLTSKGVFSYNKDGVKGLALNSTDFLNAISTAKNKWEDTPENEAAAHTALSQFVQTMDENAKAAGEDKTLFRAGDYTPQEQQAFT